jgi:hypothetical protein
MHHIVVSKKILKYVSTHKSFETENCCKCFHGLKGRTPVQFQLDYLGLSRKNYWQHMLCFLKVSFRISRFTLRTFFSIVIEMQVKLNKLAETKVLRSLIV